MFLFRAVFYLFIQNKVNSYIACQGKAGSQLKKSLPTQRDGEFFCFWIREQTDCDCPALRMMCLAF